VFYESLNHLSDEELRKERPMLFGNILALLNHVYAMDVAWSSNLQGLSHQMQTRNPKNTQSLNDLRDKQSKINSWYANYTTQLSSKQLDEFVGFTFIGGGEGKMKIHQILQHVVNHASYHRGHIEGVMYQMLVEPPTTDIPVFLKTEIEHVQ